MAYVLYKPIIKAHEEFSNIEKYPRDLYNRMLTLLDGEKDADEIIGILLLESFNVNDVMEIITDLVNEQIIEESPDSDLGAFSKKEINLLEKQLHAFSKLSFDRGGMFLPYSKNALKHQKALKDAKVTIIGDGLIVESFVRNLAATGIGTIYVHSLSKSQGDNAKLNPEAHFSDIHYYDSVAGDGFDFIKDAAGLVVYAPEVFSEEAALEINRQCVAYKKDFLPYQLDFPNVFIGPFYRYKQSACYNCYTLRKAGAVNDFLAKKNEPGGNVTFNLPFGSDMLCLEVIKYFTYVLDATTLDNVFSIDIITGKAKQFTAFKLPRCPICGIHKLKPTQKIWENM